MRISFATDIARAVAYLHVRKCLHRDLKGENLLITANDRVKICDFGFARIAARNEDEMKRISYCGTDGYMSPEVLLGLDFSLPSDVFSLGVIFCEIAARHLVDANVFARQMPDFGIDEREIREMASTGCPEDFIQLCIDCVDTDPTRRPDMREVVSRLRDIELEVTAREDKGTVKAVGSVRGSSLHAIMGGSKFSKRTKARAMPSFNTSDDAPVTGSTRTATRSQHHGRNSGSSSDDEDLEFALAQLEELKVTAEPQELLSREAAVEDTFKPAGHGNPWWSDSSSSSASSISNLYADWHTNMPEPTPPLASPANTFSSLLPSASGGGAETDLNATPTASVIEEPIEEVRDEEVKDCVAASTLTIKETKPDKDIVPEASMEEQTVSPEEGTPASAPGSFISASSRFSNASVQEVAERGVGDGSTLESLAASSISPQLYHRFTLIRNGTRRLTVSKAKDGSGAPSPTSTSPVLPNASGGLLPPALMLTQALARCRVCSKRIGWRPFLDCDDCPYRCHVACGEIAEPSCREIDMPQPAGEAQQHKQSSSEGFDAAEGAKQSSKKSHGAVGTGSNAPLLTVVNAERRVFSIEELNEVALIGQALTKTGVGKKSRSGSEEEARALPPSPIRGSIMAGAGGAAARLKRWSRGGSTAATAAAAAGRGAVKT
jgi:LIM domain kinase 1